jgi:hypothetical protein
LRLGDFCGSSQVFYQITLFHVTPRKNKGGVPESGSMKPNTFYDL